MIPGISLTALGADVTEPGKSYLLDNLSYPSDNTLNKRPSLVRDIIAKSGETELPTQPDGSSPKRSEAEGYYGTKDWRAYCQPWYQDQLNA